MPRHSAVPRVASFPPAALPAFSGTTKRSDSPRPICLPLLFGSSGILSSTGKRRGASRVAVSTPCQVCRGLRPRRGGRGLSVLAVARVDAHDAKRNVPPGLTITGLVNLILADTACLLACLRLKLELGPPPPSLASGLLSFLQGLLPGGLTCLPGRDSHPLVIHDLARSHLR